MKDIQARIENALRDAPIDDAARRSAQRSRDPYAAEALFSLMSDISEICYCAGWLIGLEHVLWKVWEKPLPFKWGIGEVVATDVAALRTLHERAGGWWRWDDDTDSEAFVTTEEWLRIVGEP